MDTPTRVLEALDFLQRSFAWNISECCLLQGGLYCGLSTFRYALWAVYRQFRAFEFLNCLHRMTVSVAPVLCMHQVISSMYGLRLEFD